MSEIISVVFRKGEPGVRVIMAFRGAFSFLSNFHKAEVVLPAEWVRDRFGNEYYCPEMVFPTNEHAYMAWKLPYPHERERIRLMATAREVKEWSQTEEFRAMHRADYTVEGRMRCFLMLCRQKFSLERHPDLARRLVEETEDAILMEGTTWFDDLCGLDMTRGCGKNYLGRILMTVRDEVREQMGLPRLQPIGYYLPTWMFADDA